MNKSNLAALGSLPLHEQGEIGLLLAALLWAFKQIADRISKRVLNRYLPEKDGP